MLHTRPARLAALGLVLAALVAAIVAFGTLTPNPAAGRYPGTDEVASDPGRYHGDRVVVDGTVVGTDPITLEATYETVRDGAYDQGTMSFRVTDVSTPVERGVDLQVFGTLRPDRSIEATNTVSSAPSDRLYMYAVSFIAGLWVLVRLARQWRFDPGRFAIVSRSTPADPPREQPSTASNPDQEAEQ